MSAPLAVPAMNRHTATVIFLHGLGDQGAGWIDLAVNWRRRQKFTETKFIFPNAPSIAITLVSACLSGLWSRYREANEVEWWHAHAGLV
jgi:predicted esterase